MNETIAVKLKNLPLCPGCYLMKDAAGTVIYVGKAINLKNRVSQYFQESRGHTVKVRAMVANVHDFDIVLCTTNLEALILECNLIKKYRPQYNILLKDDKHYPYLRIDLASAYPSIEIVRRVEKDGAKYFGPYIGTNTIREVFSALHELFPIRTCEGPIHPESGKRPCLHYQLGECAAPCAGRISSEDYRAMVMEIVDFLSGKSEGVMRRLEAQMKDASDHLRFEEAALVRDRIKSAGILLQRQKTIDVRGGDCDILAVATDGLDSVVTVLLQRDGRIEGSENFSLEGDGDQKPEDILASFLTQFYDDGRRPPSEIVCQALPENAEDLAEILRERREGRMELLTPARGRKRQLVEMAKRNAEDALKKRNAALSRKMERTTGACLELANAIGLEKPPRRIEGYDISNTQGILSVASMVVFIDGMPATKEYRRFRIRTVEGANDFASMNEVLTRRLARAKLEQEQQNGKEPFTGFADLPDVILIDGGPEQLLFAREAMLGQGFDIPIFGLAKRLEEIFLPGQEESIILSRKSPALHLIQRVRDEAHRFCITHHRNLRQKEGMHSQLEKIPGIGPARRKALLREFKSVAAIRAATVEELQRVEGIGKAQAEAIVQYFNSRGT
ncbi:MAG: excinuclease ABC subunit UvrC [Clostridiales bacterium]|nr:excinuclease ABC subunit UvrC [Clostridiales bacterium]